MTTLTFAEKIQESGLERWDSVEGTVFKETTKGALVSFSNDCGESFTGFAYTSLPIGSNVLCSIRKIFLEDEFIILSVDSVLEAAA